MYSGSNRPCADSSTSRLASLTLDLDGERREHQRLRTVYRIVPAETDQDSGLVRMRNISDRGMALEVGFPTCLGDSIRLTLAEGDVLRGTVVWSKENECGVRFDAPIDSIRVLRESAVAMRSALHRQPRLPISRKGVASSERGMRAVELRDVSQRGMKLLHDGSFTPGLHVKVSLSSGVERRGVVRWTRDRWAGVMLTEPFSARELGAISAL